MIRVRRMMTDALPRVNEKHRWGSGTEIQNRRVTASIGSPSQPSTPPRRLPGAIDRCTGSTLNIRIHDMTVIKEDAAEWTGGCQCGAVRYQLLTPPEHACLCHCRMCQRASGQPFMAFVSVRREDLRWTRGSPSTFVSSNVAERNFCSACGTPLTYHRVESGSIAVTIGSLDAPEAVRPIEQFGIESELSWISGLRALPAKRTEDWRREYRIPHIDSHQCSA